MISCLCTKPTEGLLLLNPPLAYVFGCHAFLPMSAICIRTRAIAGYLLLLFAHKVIGILCLEVTRQSFELQCIVHKRTQMLSILLGLEEFCLQFLSQRDTVCIGVADPPGSGRNPFVQRCRLFVAFTITMMTSPNGCQEKPPPFTANRQKSGELGPILQAAMLRTTLLHTACHNDYNPIPLPL